MGSRSILIAAVVSNVDYERARVAL